MELLPFTAKFLDYGCGYGRISRLLKNAGYVNLIGYDTSIGMIKRGNVENPDLNLQYNESYSLPLKNRSFDAVVLAAVLTSLPGKTLRVLVLEEIKRVLKPNGILILSEFLRDSRREYDEHGCFNSKLGIRMKHFHESEISSILQDWEIIHFKSTETESVNRSIVPAVHVIAHSSSY